MVVLCLNAFSTVDPYLRDLVLTSSILRLMAWRGWGGCEYSQSDHTMWHNTIAYLLSHLRY